MARLASRSSPAGAYGGLDSSPAMRNRTLSRRRSGKVCGEMSYNLVDGKWGHVTIAKAGEINKADREIPYDGGRQVFGGTPFAYQLDRKGKPAQPYAAYAK